MACARGTATGIQNKCTRAPGHQFWVSRGFFFPSLHCREVGVGQGGHWLNQMGSSLLSGALGFGAAQVAYWANNCLQRFEDGFSSYCRQQPNPYLTAIWCVFVCPLDRESSHKPIVPSHIVNFLLKDRDFLLQFLSRRSTWHVALCNALSCIATSSLDNVTYRVNCTRHTSTCAAVSL